MATYWLKPASAGGNDANDGDSTLEAWASWGRAAQRLWLPGDRLIVAGEFPGIAGVVELKGGGDAADPVIVEGNGAVLSFATGLANSPKFVVCGVGFVAEDLVVTQATKGSNPGDRMVVAQLSQDGQHAPSDVVFRRIRASNGYELFKASGWVQRIRFERCEGHDARIGGGIAGAADDCAFAFCTLWDCSDDGIQAKGGCRNPLLLGNVYGGACGGAAFQLGGTSAIEDGSVPPWWRDEGYECANGLAVANLVVGVPGEYTGSGVLFRGAHDCRAAYNTLVNLDGTSHYSDGIEDGFTLRRSGGSGWADGAPNNDGCVIEQNVLRRITTTLMTRNASAGSHAYRRNTHHLCDWVTEAGDLTGTWAMSANATRDPRLADVSGATDWRAVAARLAPGSPERGAGVPLAHAWFGGEASPHAAALDRFGVARPGDAWDRGAFEESARDRRRDRRRKWRRAA